MRNSRPTRREHYTPPHVQSLNQSDLECWLPSSVVFVEDKWNVGSWMTRADRKVTFTLDFSKISHLELRHVIKLQILHMRSTDRIAPITCYSIVVAAVVLSNAIGDIRLRDLTSSAFVGLPSSKRTVQGLKAIVRHLRTSHGLPIFYTAPKRLPATYGSHGTEAGRSSKLISDSILMQVIALNQRSDLLPIDKLMVLAVAINVSCGWRISELLALKVGCLFSDEGALYLSGYPRKGGTAVTKMILPSLAPMVASAYQDILDLTERGRKIAREWASASEPNWIEVVKDRGATLYYAQKLLHKWTKDPAHRILNPDGAWHRKRGWIDILGSRSNFRSDREHREALGLCPAMYYNLKKQQEMAQSGIAWRRSARPGVKEWRGDTRVCDAISLFKQMGYATGQDYHSPEIKDLIQTALTFQLRGEVMPEPQVNADLELKYLRTRPVHSRDPDGAATLFVDEALFVVDRKLFSPFSLVSDGFQVITPAHMSHWLSGSRNRPSVFHRYGIIDSKTGSIAAFKSHDIRHWLETQFHRGGLSDSQIDAISGRKNGGVTSVYNQMSNGDKRSFVKEGIHKGIVEGVLVDICSSSSYTKEEADHILESRLRHINVLPFGLCLQDLAMQPCPHHLSCFSATCGNTSGPCEHLIVDTTDADQRAGLQEEKRRATAMIDLLREDEELCSSPQLAHFETVVASVNGFLSEDSDEQ